MDLQSYSNLLFHAQLLRGNTYREYRGIASQLEPDGRYCQAIDPQSWHILLQNGTGRVVGCSRYRPVYGGFDQLFASNTSLAQSRRFGATLRRAVEKQVASAHRKRLQYSEVGSWALRPDVRRSTAGVNIALMTFVLADYLGGGIGITTAVTRHHSASILRRLGGQRLAGLPAYYEPKVGCVIEILGFDMADLNAQFADRVERLAGELEEEDIICATGASNITRQNPNLCTICRSMRHLRNREGQVVP